MEPRMKISGLWRMRDDTINDAVRKLNETFHRLASLSPRWSNWWRSYESMADRDLGPTILMDHPNLIHDELVNGQHREMGQFDETLGYFLSASAGPPKGKGTEGSGFWLHCCTRTPTATNEIRLEFPVRAAANELYDRIL